MIAAQRISQLTPMEVDILFTMSDLYEANGRITMRDIERITPFEEGVLPYNIASQQSEQMTAPGERNVAYLILRVDLLAEYLLNQPRNHNMLQKPTLIHEISHSKSFSFLLHCRTDLSFWFGCSGWYCRNIGRLSNRFSQNSTSNSKDNWWSW